MNNSLKKEKDKSQLDFFCPVCGCNRFERAQRTVLEKSIYYISGGNKADRKFQCTNCGWTVLLGKGKKR